jgi:hypothetical protein
MVAWEKIDTKDLTEVVVSLVRAEAYSATKFISKNFVIRATKPCYRRRKKQWSARDTRDNLVLTVGVPNYREREFVKKFSSGTLPTEVQIRNFPVSRAASG